MLSRFGKCDADGLAKMMAGFADTFLLEVLRGWDQGNKILLVPGMSSHMWDNPMTRRQLSKIHRKWSWVRTMPPVLWHYNGAKRVDANRDCWRRVQRAGMAADFTWDASARRYLEVYRKALDERSGAAT